MEARPASGGASPVRIFMVVVLPAPLSPRKAYTAPRGTRRSSPSRAAFPRYRTTTRSVTITSSGMENIRSSDPFS